MLEEGNTSAFKILVPAICGLVSGSNVAQASVALSRGACRIADRLLCTGGESYNAKPWAVKRGQDMRYSFADTPSEALNAGTTLQTHPQKQRTVTGMERMSAALL